MAGRVGSTAHDQPLVGCRATLVTYACVTPMASARVTWVTPAREIAVATRFVRGEARTNGKLSRGEHPWIQSYRQNDIRVLEHTNSGRIGKHTNTGRTASIRVDAHDPRARGGTREKNADRKKISGRSPCVRGAFLSWATYMSPPGESPCARGNLRHALHLDLDPRLIPVRAGYN